ncbi:unnamed protein product [Vicia faba]|uniref:DUF4218 domain-containing protein n=1 Tax=Vicia faba TaxID=3906 RepID=A0AAV0YXU9_VICFA|nr:unnamed protein product [Vicia faba]
MDKSWIIKPQSSIAYQKGIQEFIYFAFKGAKENDGYTMWIHHGESFVRSSTISPSTTPSMVEDTNIVKEPIQNMINDAFGVYGNHANEIPSASNLEIEQEDYVMPSSTQERNEAKEYYELAREGEQPLYEGCRRYSRLSFLVKLYHIKCLCGLSEKAMTMILKLIKYAFEYANIPSSFYEAKKSITKLGLNYVKIPACPNGCMLYWGEDEEKETCKNCNTSKWKTNEDVSVNKKKKENSCQGLACPLCNFQTTPLHLKASRKWCFMGHRRFLDRRHRFRLNKIRFNGEQEMRSPPRTLSGHEVFEKVKDVEVIFGKKAVKEKSVKRTREEQPIEGDSTQCDPTKEVKLGGPVHYRWMYPVERYLGKLKSYAHRHVLTNCPIVDDYLKQFRSFSQNQMRRSQRSATEIDKKIRNNLDNIHGPDKDVLISLSHGPFDKSVKGRSRFVQPGELEVNKKRLRSITTRKSSITPPPMETTITPPPMETTITPPSIQIAKDVVVEDEDEDDTVGDEADDVVVGDGTGDVVLEDAAEDVVVGDEAEDDVVGDEAEDVVLGDEAGDVVVGDGTGDVVVGDGTGDVVKVAKSEYWDVNVISK